MQARQDEARRLEEELEDARSAATIEQEAREEAEDGLAELQEVKKELQRAQANAVGAGKKAADLVEQLRRELEDAKADADVQRRARRDAEGAGRGVRRAPSSGRNQGEKG